MLRRADQAGVARILAVGTDYESSYRAVACAARYDQVYAAVGLHPHHADRLESDAPALADLLDEPKVVAIGEIGIDRVRTVSGIDRQVATFSLQLGWAAERGLPVSVHNREADAEVLAVLAAFPVTAILHCFSSSLETARTAVAAGHLLSIAGNVTFPRADGIREVARAVPLDSILLETDAPVLAPQPWRGRRNEPSYLGTVCESVAAARDESPETVGAATWANAGRVFKWGVG